MESIGYEKGQERLREQRVAIFLDKIEQLGQTVFYEFYNVSRSTGANVGSSLKLTNGVRPMVEFIIVGATIWSY